MSETAVELAGVGKMYKIFATRMANLLDALSLPGSGRYSEFWALRGIELKLERGARVGVVGRNGAGKSTLLKLITQNVAPTEGSVVVRGNVQALMDAGAGFHPEFTGRENIRASLTLQGASEHEIRAAVEEIAEFTELGQFLEQPFRTYSAGMQARLAFATATAVQPDILIVDEMLSAGDAYFSHKAGERMRSLVDSGASLLLVSHSLDHITMFCEEAIWIDRGRIVETGPSLEVVKAYQQFTRVLEDRRLTSRNRKSQSGLFSSHELDAFSDSLIVRFTVAGPGACEVDTVSLWREGALEESLDVGGAQDADISHAAHVLLDASDWSGPRTGDERMSRMLAAIPGATATGSVAFSLYSIFDDSPYALEVSYCAEAGTGVQIDLIHDGVVRAGREERPTGEGWTTARLELGGHDLAPRHVGVELATLADLPAFDDEDESRVSDAKIADKQHLTRWPGEGTLFVREVLLRDENGDERGVFERGSTLSVFVRIEARSSETFDFTPGISLYRIDGVLVSNHAGPSSQIDLDAGELTELELTLEELNLGDGRYTLSIALFRRLDALGDSILYDLIDRSIEFEIFGSEPFENGVFTHPAQWRMRHAPADSH